MIVLFYGAASTSYDYPTRTNNDLIGSLKRLYLVLQSACCCQLDALDVRESYLEGKKKAIL
ncbi:hypothetical protein JCM19240_1124 [Vibrio maritimus]|uniref:Uncharacterized protein n=1 Tax=Vibrio maritimus TaxID=990268 RepID=A0A090T2M5_9VIBR|nr:hypothetical protein JCM19240_1124 [Vibrio maritimus]